MHSTKKKEQFNIAYVAAIAAQAGISNLSTVVDDDSIDVVLIGKGFSGKVRNPQIQLQLKCTSQNLITGSTIKFPLSLKNYDDLRGTDVLCPRYLVVLMVPENDDHWIEHDNDCMKLHNLCFWVSLKDKPSTSNSTSVTVEVPTSQRLTTQTLIKLMNEASNV